mmetsp:Transcript_52215/g.131224  ORF Transcript_52215/g.131224 Transcript_52215/m.131224 type:complete len:253 (-) Transcript_52215:39-797(-)
MQSAYASPLDAPLVARHALRCQSFLEVVESVLEGLLHLTHSHRLGTGLCVDGHRLGRRKLTRRSSGQLSGKVDSDFVEDLSHDALLLLLVSRVGHGVVDGVGHHLLGESHLLVLLHELLHDLVQRRQVHLLVHPHHHLGDALHGLGHGLCGLDGLQPQVDGLQLRPHLVKLCLVLAGADQITSHDLHRTHLSLVGHGLDVADELLLAVLELHPLPVQLPDGPVDLTLVAPQLLIERFRLSLAHLQDSSAQDA